MTPKYGIDDLLMGFSIVAVLFAILGYIGYDLELASSQWMLIGIFLACWGIYLKVSPCNKKK